MRLFGFLLFGVPSDFHGTSNVLVYLRSDDEHGDMVSPAVINYRDIDFGKPLPAILRISRV
jgi:hypothetical protein